ncbi:hypothetical protein MVEN_01779600 [Mycena venus]|uniref:Protein kinase domain-containing protein n=1 Tax=Mycena venus TaxID=2733690 RepID=A0A8H7CPH1_9AGAR|nr:hypothetical protein MVEN_01779600 [Mycena venus]
MFFETFGERVAEICTAAGKSLPTKRRSWTSQFATKGVTEAPNVRMPDFLLGAESEYRWPNIQVHGELESSNSKESQDTVRNRLLNGTYLIFSHQDNRRFVLSIAFMAEHVRLFIFDRAGLLSTAPFNLHDEPEDFVRVLVALMFTNDPAVLGYDTSILEIADDRYIGVEGVLYEIVGKPLFISDVIRGRGTICWRVRSNGQYFVIKDTWADASRPQTEADILRMVQGVDGVPKVVQDIIVKVNGKEGRTHTLRSHLPPKFDELNSQIERRVHRRLVLTPLGNSLSTFASRKELISAFIDAVTAHRDLYNVNILHRDLSINNILLVSPSSNRSTPSPSSAVPASSHLPCSTTISTSTATDLAAAAHPGRPRGLLIDFDYALVLNPNGERGPVATGHRTGTLPFMAVDVLVEGDELPLHEPRHDLESLLYVLIWVCVHYAGPHDVERQNFNIYQSNLRTWVSGESYMSIGKAKYSSMHSQKYWKADVLDNFAPYFEPLQPCVTAWRQLFIGDDLTYDSVLGVLQTALASLDDKEWSEKDDPEGYGDRSRKRKRLARIMVEDEGEDDNQVFKVSRSATGTRAVQSEPVVRPPLPLQSEQAPAKIKLKDRMQPRSKIPPKVQSHLTRLLDSSSDKME